MAKIAIEFLHHKERYLDKNYRGRKYFYIINNYIYYVAIGSDNNEFSKLEKWVNILSNAKTNNIKFWQYRFDDTLALYYLRKAVISLNNGNDIMFKVDIKEARERNKDALKFVLLVDDSRIFNDTKRQIERVEARYSQ